MLSPELDHETVVDASQDSIAPAAGAATSVDVAIVGGGASGALCAIHLMASRAHNLRVSIHEPSRQLGQGIAYGTHDRRHLLNVRSRHMSAFPDIPSDLAQWAARTGREPDVRAFLPRSDYAIYLRETLARLADERLHVRAERVESIEPGAGGFRLRSGGSETFSRAVVLAVGNARPARLAFGDGPLPEAPWHLEDPWDADRLERLGRDAVVVIVGTGLTAVDVAISLLADHASRKVAMVSRHGLLPAAHVEQSSTAWVSPIPDGPVTADGLAELVREQVAAARLRGVDWRPVIDGLRASTQSLWRRLDLRERRRFLAVHARHWEVRRHRMAPEVAARIERYRADGRLTVLGGGLTGVVDHGGRCEVEAPGLPDPVFADAVVNCTGPETDVEQTSDPLLRSLVDSGLLASDPLGLGVGCTAQGEVLDVEGAVVPGLHVVGPARKGALWETTAVPEIRGQAAELARVLPERLRAG